MKRISILIIAIGCIFILSSCNIKNKSIMYEDGYDITIAEELQPYFIYSEQIPILHFDMKNVNVSTTSNNYQLILVNNDFNLVSDAWEKHLKKYGLNYIVLENAAQTREDKKAKFGNVDMDLDEFDEFGNKQEYSREIRLVAWSNSGTRYSYQFRTFVSGGKRYFAFCYSTSLTMALEQSLMVTKVDNKNSLLLIPLPYDTKYEVSGSNLTLDSLIKKETYLDEKYYTFFYPNSLSNKTLEEKIEKVKEWYQTYCNGRMNNDEFIIDYAGATFKVTFNVTKEDSSGNKHDAFKLAYIKK